MRKVIRGCEHVAGTVEVPGDKSISHRALLIGAIAEGITTIEGCLIAEDVLSTARCLTAMGVRIEGLCANAPLCSASATLSVHGVSGANFSAPQDVLDAGNSGTTMRLLLGLLAAHRFEATIDGDESLRRRPMDRVAKPLTQMGAHISGQGDKCYPPVSIRGSRLRAIEYQMPVASAQVKSAILLAGLFADGVTSVIQPAATRDHTERMLRAFGADLSVDGLKVSIIGGATLRAQRVLVPGDFSSAAFFMALAAAIPSAKLTVKGVGLNPTRVGFIEALVRMGVDVRVENQRVASGEPVGDVTVIGCERLSPINISGEIIPTMIDELPLLAVLCSVANGESLIRDAHELRIKESDRIAAMASELSSMGADITELPDGWRIVGVRRLRGAQVKSYGDHRVAMSLAIAGMLADGETIIDDAECVSISFPQFWELLEGLVGQPD
ncbi:MAG: 3-phosphoshikimate 1-carboxyvinyltransferase [Armatimonadota bacterium]|nr:3-phosphoshikimate 1-carboxyvinyltransferase [Armatimonadota bacterium]MCX7777398.1 3-phosphoshikimate 1-carboxyvinyltransferase [Armatimonadota bacterium]MDW8025067.1 3-phosphoshikimate 1-carboxyvinyltransferase [Armatimonadota bacterium]